MLCGRPPFKEETDIATALQHVRSIASPPRQWRAGIPASVEAVVIRAMMKQPKDRFATAHELKSALLQADLSDDSTAFVAAPDAAMIGHHPIDGLHRLDYSDRLDSPTPPRGLAPKRHRLVPFLLFALTAIAVVLVGTRLLGGLNFDLGGGKSAQAVIGPIAPSGAGSFDPQGDGTENQPLVRNAIDANPATSWHSDRYNTRSFGNLKSGVGIVVTVPANSSIASVVVKSPTRQWSGSVYMAPAPSDTLAGWGKPLATAANTIGDATFNLPRTSGGAVLVWITDPGTTNRMEITEITVSG